jgi:non-specific serine/threonine protein kinase/serine/threonine-protein kinase
MTPDYASPEQLQGGAITTGSDVYSLGVLLYEILAGRRPYQLAGKTLSEALRIVCEQDPELPSAVAAGNRLSGDLDAIILKAMRKESRQRYSSAEEFSYDIGLYLSGRPVVARRRSYRYVARKFVARHKFAAAISVVATAFTLAGLAGVIIESRVAKSEHASAQRRFNDVRKLASSVLFELHDGIASLPGSTSVRKLLVTRALEYLDTLAQEARNDMSLQLELASAYGRVGDVQGGPLVANLGDTAAALASYEKARSILRGLLLRSPDSTEGRIALAQLNLRLSEVHLFVRDYDRALDTAREALSGWEAITRRSRDEQSVRGVAAAHFHIAKVMLASDDGKAALTQFQESIELHKGLLASIPDNAENQRDLALDNKYLCAVFCDLGDLKSAAGHCQDAVDLDEKRVAVNPGDSLAKQDLAYSLSETGSTYHLKGDLPRALDWLRRSLAIRQELAKADPHDIRVRISLVYPHMELGEVLAEAGRSTESMVQYKEVVRLGEPLGISNPENSMIRGRVAQAYLAMGTLEAGLARMAPESSSPRFEHQRLACSDFGRALEKYRENERRGQTVDKWEHKQAQTAAREMQSCAAY